MPEFANIEYFSPIKGEYDLNGQDIEPIDLNETYYNNPQVIRPLYDDMTVGIPITKDQDNTVPTGVYVVMWYSDEWPWGDVQRILVVSRQRNYSGRRIPGEPMFSNFGFSVAVWTPGNDIIAAYHPPALPIFVKEKRIGGLWVKQGQQLVKPSGVYVKQNGTIKKM